MTFQSFFRKLQGERPGMSAGTLRTTHTFLPYYPITIQTQILLGDVSYYQGEINFEVMKASGVDGVIIRAGQRNWEDSKFKTNWRRAKEAGLPRGAYFLYDSREDPQKQAALWWSLLKDDPAELVYVADLEENYGGAYGMPSHMRTFIQEFQRLSGLPDDRIVIYTGFFWWSQRVGNDSFFRRFALWLAWYAAMSVVRVPAPWIETDLIFWQFTSSGDGPLHGVSSKEIDLNWYCCDAHTYSLRFHLGAPQPDEDTMTEPYLKLTASIPGEYRSIRAPASPSILGAKIGQIDPGSFAKAYPDEGKVVYTQDVTLGGITRAKAGDVWLKVFEANGAPIDGMIAEIHLGFRYLIVETVAPAPAPSHVVEVVIDGVVEFRKEF